MNHSEPSPSSPGRSCALWLAASLSSACVGTGEARIGEAALRAGAPIAAETSGWQRTSTHAEVDVFLGQLATFEHGDRISCSTFGTTTEGRAMAIVTVADPLPTGDVMADPRLRVLINGNIHAGEVEGKEAIQMLLREFAAGYHAELLDELVIQFVPIYNADGNERIDVSNRVTQNGPNEGVGIRPNAQGLDLNRDFLKAESPECKALLGVFRRFDPHLFMDLHTTNGSYHGYHLTYSPSLSTNVDAAIDDYARTSFIPEIRAAMAATHGLRIFDYGNFTGEEDRRWATYDHRPRFGTNYYGLRNRFSVLSEAYSYLDFQARVRATRAFVLETLVAGAQNAATMRRLCAVSDARVEAGEFVFGYASELVAPGRGDVLVGGIEEVELPDGIGTRRIALAEFEPEEMGIQSAFVSRESSAPPVAWAIPFDAETEGMLLAIANVLDEHGIEYERLTSDLATTAQHYATTKVTVAERPFQGHAMMSVEGDWQGEGATLLPAGSIVIPARQRLGRLVAQLLAPESEDSLLTWNFLDAGVERGTYPVLRLPTIPSSDEN